MKSKLGLPKLVQHLTGYMEVFGTEVESDLTQSWKYTDQWCCQHSYTHAKIGKFTNGMPKDWSTSIQAVLENFLWSSGKTGFQPQKSWKGQGCRVYTSFEIGTVKIWTGHVTRMPDERLPKKILYGELQVGKRSHGGQKKWYKDTLKTSLKTSTYQQSWEQIAQDQQSGEA